MNQKVQMVGRGPRRSSLGHLQQDFLHQNWVGSSFSLLLDQTDQLVEHFFVSISDGVNLQWSKKRVKTFHDFINSQTFGFKLLTSSGCESTTFWQMLWTCATSWTSPSSCSWTICEAVFPPDLHISWNTWGGKQESAWGKAVGGPQLSICSRLTCLAAEEEMRPVSCSFSSSAKCAGEIGLKWN